LQIDSSSYDRDRNCTMLCIFPAYNLLVTVSGPRPLSVDSPSRASVKEMPDLPEIPDLPKR
jgi:hypothetical protein